MLNRFLSALNARMYIPVILALVAGAAFAETTVRVDYGTVESIEIFRTADRQPVNAGTVLGGLAGGVIGHQIGSGRGNTAATIAGAVGGAVVGTEIEKRHAQSLRYRIAVRLDSGSSLIVDDAREVNLRVGDRVRIENNRIDRE